MRAITLVLPHFQNLGMWAEQQKVWADYPAAIRSQLHVVLVDDCSPKGFRPGPKSVTVSGLASLRMYRLLQKKRWNWLACRNLGAKVATTDWLLLTDIDHVIPVETMRALMEQPLDPKSVYRFRRATATRCWPYPLSACTEYKPHNDTWLIARSLFWTPIDWSLGRYLRGVGGYDERLSGCYGTSGEFSDRVKATATAMTLRTDVIIRYPREVLADASTPPSAEYTRKGDDKNDTDLANRKAARAQINAWQPLNGLIPHEDVYSTIAEPLPCSA